MRLTPDSPILSFDVESIGLHGEGFAVGIVLARNRKVVDEYLFWCDPKAAQGEDDDRLWVARNIPPSEDFLGKEKVQMMALSGPRQVRGAFWNIWEKNRISYELVADVCWPVEARFLFDCIKDDPQRRNRAPYPLLDVSTITALTGQSAPKRRPDELPRHHPLMDARHSLRSLWESLDHLEGRCPTYPFGSSFEFT